MVSESDCKYISSRVSQKVQDNKKTVFERFQAYLPVLRKVGFLYYFKAVLKRLAFNSNTTISYVRLKILNFKNIPPYPGTYGEVTPLLVELMTSQRDNNVLLCALYI